VVESQGKVVCIGTEFVNSRQRWASQGLGSPLLEISRQAEEFLPVNSVVDVPDLLLNVGIEIFEASFGAVSDLEKGVQKALNQNNERKECPPRLLGSPPSICVDRLWLVVRIDVERFFFEVAIG
jgi:hypothetical protein